MIVVPLVLPAQILTILLSPLLFLNLSYPEFSFLIPHPQMIIDQSLSQSPRWNLWTWSQTSFLLSDILVLFLFLICQMPLPSPPPFPLLIFVLFGFLNNCCVLFNQLHSVMDIVPSYYHLLYCSYLLNF